MIDRANPSTTDLRSKFGSVYTVQYAPFYRAAGLRDHMSADDLTVGSYLYERGEVDVFGHFGPAFAATLEAAGAATRRRWPEPEMGWCLFMHTGEDAYPSLVDVYLTEEAANRGGEVEAGIRPDPRSISDAADAHDAWINNPTRQ